MNATDFKPCIVVDALPLAKVVAVTGLACEAATEPRKAPGAARGRWLWRVRPDGRRKRLRRNEAPTAAVPGTRIVPGSG